MQQYTKSLQYYEDSYDRVTIQGMKEYEARIQAASGNDLEIIKLKMLYNNFGAERAGKREECIRDSRESDLRRDNVISNTPIPKQILCKTCNGEMLFETHSFSSDDKLVFYFKCSKGHLPKTALYSDGSERYIKPKCCSYCAGPIETKKKQTKNKLVFTDTCKHCGKAEIDEYDLTEEKNIEIKEEDRVKYCVNFIGSRTLQQDLQSLMDFSDYLDEQKEKTYDYSHVEQINIAELEKRLIDTIEKVGFAKVLFEKPKSGRWLTVEFSAQDLLPRDRVSSIRAIKKVITKTLFSTNWRLMTTGIEYRLGYLTGELKGYSSDEDLIKLGKEIASKR